MFYLCLQKHPSQICTFLLSRKEAEFKMAASLACLAPAGKVVQLLRSRVLRLRLQAAEQHASYRQDQHNRSQGEETFPPVQHTVPPRFKHRNGSLTHACGISE